MDGWRSRGVAALALSAVFLYGYPSATIFYAGLILFHAFAGILLALLLLPFLFRVLRQSSAAGKLGWTFLACGTALGVVLVKIGTPHRLRYWLYAHIALSALGVLLLAAAWMQSRGWLGIGAAQVALRSTALLLVFAGVAAGSWWTRNIAWQNANRIVNPEMPAASMDEEGDGPQGKFFPSSVQTKDGGYIPAKYFMQSQACERCHGDIYKQWESSGHHFSSFNNQWYRKSIEYMQDVNGVKPSKWCAGCHDPALLFSGMFDRPIREIEHTPAAQAGLACMMCHSIVQVKSTMGQGDFLLEYPKLHELAASDNQLIRTVHDFLVKVNPEPHRRVFLKPFMKTQTAEFCSGCHKAHLDVPVNNYRWVRGFNEYDNWQGSGISGQGARSFYYPKAPMTCPDCHMPQVRSSDFGNVDGLVHSHRFPGANTAVPTANEDQSQLELSTSFLKDNQLSVDIFALSPAQKSAPAASAATTATGPEISTTFAVGEESESYGAKNAAIAAQPVTAPLGQVNAAVRRGDDVRIDVVVRTRKVGHFFPGGTVDAFDVWLELQAVDEKDQMLFWSGQVQGDGKGPVESGAHFYRSQQIDAHGNVINKRNTWSTRAAVYVNLIPPGAADTVHYRMHVPENAAGKITLHARLNYRKFMWWNTQFAYAGTEAAGYAADSVAKHYDDRQFAFTTDTSGVAGKLKEIPTLPIITVAEDTKSIRVLPHTAAAPGPQVKLVKDDWMRWNDYGIGLFLQGDLKGAEAAFQKVADLDPQRPDGWLNIGRALAQEGDTEGARAAIDKVLAINPKLAAANYFYARVLKADGKYGEAAVRLRIALAQYPRDRVVRNELGRVLFLQKRYADAVKEFEQTLAVDPEDLQAHYNLMLCYNGLGDDARANEHKARYLRFKADESAQAITGPYRQKHPVDNNERQAVHEHISVEFGKTPVKKLAAAAAVKASPVTSVGRSASGKD